MVADEPAPVLHGFLLDRVPGIEPVYLPLLNGLTVFFGVNGAGKSRIMTAVQGIWEGRRTGVRAVVHVPLPQDVPASEGEEDPWYHEPVCLSLLQQQMGPSLVPLAQRAPHTIDEPVPLFHEQIEEAYRRLLHDLVHHEEANTDPYLGPLAPDRRGQVLAELQRQRLILITPRGSRDRPEWQWQPFVWTDPAYPQITSELERDAGAERTEGCDGAGDWQTDDDLFEIAVFERVAFLRADAQPQLAGVFGRLPALVLDTTFEPLGLLPLDTGVDRLQIEGGVKRLRAQLGGIASAGAETDSDNQDALTQNLDAYSRTLNRHYGQALRDAPGLNLLLHPEAAWLGEDPLTIETTAGHDVAQLSSAERKWADWAVAQTAQDHSDPDGATSALIEFHDEPEAALHRAAEAHMADAIYAHAARPNRHVFVATHSPELLNQPDAHVFEVRKRFGEPSKVVAFTATDRDDLEELGLLPSDLLRRQKAFLLVEGEHDELLLKAFIGPELAHLRVEILPLRGAVNLPTTIESRLLYDFTDAQVIALVDNVEGAEIRDAWNAATSMAKTDGAAAAGDLLRSSLGSSTTERQWLAQWLSRALELGREGRVMPYGLTEPDILHYLPVQCFVPQATSWGDLRAEHRTNMTDNKHGLPKDFKKWLSRKFDTNFDVPTIASAVVSAPDTPAEIEKLLDEISRCTGQTATT